MASVTAAPLGVVAPVSLSEALDAAPTSRFHRRAAIVSGVGFFTDAYDLFVISTVAVLVTKQWHLGKTQASWVLGSAILGAFLGAVFFGRLADRIGRRPVYGLVAAIMVLGAVASALAPDYAVLVVTRFVLGVGIGGDYPVSAVLMSEYSNRNDRGRLVGIVFSMQAVGLIVGPLVAIGLLASGAGNELTWRLLLGFGAIPAAAVIWLRARMPESPRFKANVLGDLDGAASDLAAFSGQRIVAGTPPRQPAASTRRQGALSMLADRRTLALIVGTAGAWLLFDYAYYGTTLSLPAILASVSPHASTIGKLVLTLVLFVAFALPGYLLAVWKMDAIGHRRLQILGFAVMAAAYVALGVIHALTTVVPLFVAVFGLTYFFVEFGPNTTTFVLPAEVFRTDQRTTGHGIAAGLGKLGAFVGVFLVPQLQASLGLRGMLLVAGGASLAGLACSRLLPEPRGVSLDEVTYAPSGSRDRSGIAA